MVVLPENMPLPLSSEGSSLLLALNCVQPACRPAVGEIPAEPASSTALAAGSGSPALGSHGLCVLAY